MAIKMSESDAEALMFKITGDASAFQKAMDDAAKKAEETSVKITNANKKSNESIIKEDEKATKAAITGWVEAKRRMDIGKGGRLMEDAVGGVGAAFGHWQAGLAGVASTMALIKWSEVFNAAALKEFNRELEKTSEIYSRTMHLRKRQEGEDDQMRASMNVDDRAKSLEEEIKLLEKRAMLEVNQQHEARRKLDKAQGSEQLGGTTARDISESLGMGSTSNKKILQEAEQRFKQAGMTIKETKDRLFELKDQLEDISGDDATKAMNRFRQEVDAQQKSIGLGRDGLRLYHMEMTARLSPAQKEEAKNLMETTRRMRENHEASERLKKTSDDFLKSLRDSVTMHGKSADEIKREELATGKLDAAKLKLIDTAMAEKKALDDKTKLKDRGKQVTQQIEDADPHKRFLKDIKEQETLFKANEISAEVFKMSIHNIENAYIDAANAGLQFKAANASIDASLANSFQAAKRLDEYRMNLNAPGRSTGGLTQGSSKEDILTTLKRIAQNTSDVAKKPTMTFKPVGTP